jgi:hypothetical protein
MLHVAGQVESSADQFYSGEASDSVEKEEEVESAEVLGVEVKWAEGPVGLTY